MWIIKGQLHPKRAFPRATLAGETIHPEKIASGVYLHVVVLGRRPNPDLSVVQPDVVGRAEAANGEVDGGENSLMAAAIVDLEVFDGCRLPAGELLVNSEDHGSTGSGNKGDEEEEEGEEERGKGRRFRQGHGGVSGVLGLWFLVV